MAIFHKTYSMDFVKTHKIAFAFSILLIFFSIFGFFSRGLNLGIDFTGGILFDLSIDNADINIIRNNISKSFSDVSIQSYGENGIMMKVSLKAIEGKDKNFIIEAVKSSMNDIYKGEIKYNKIDFVGPQVGSELIKNGILALTISFIAIMIYIWIRFEWQFGLGAILALLHDVILMIGLFVWSRLEFDLTAIASILTIVGYSINDSVVIYDRIRELSQKNKGKSLADNINLSLNSTLSRTILTAGTTIIALLSLIFLGGDTLESFSISVLFGVISGTYSSIYISAPILLYISKKK